MKKTVSLLLALVLMTALSGAALAYTPGTYDGVGTGMGGAVHVLVTFDENAITAIEIGENAETALISEPALTRYPQDIVKYQSLDVDMASGATISCAAVYTAVCDAVAQAGGDVEALKSAPVAAPEKAADEQMEADIVVVGGGLAGMTAAYHAEKAGAKVVLLEKLESFGGSSARSAGAVCHATQEGDPDGYYAQEDYANWLIEMGHGNVNEALIRKMVAMSDENVQIMREIGYELPYEMGETLPNGLYSRIANPLSDETFISGGGGKMMKAFYDTITANENITVLGNTPVTALVTENGAVVGVKAERKDGSVLTVSAKNVILATGNFNSSAEYLAQITPGVAKNMINTAGVGNSGDGIWLCESVGAALNLDVPCPVGGVFGANAAIDIKTALLVNAEGNRFVNEATSDVFLQGAVAKNPTGACYYIVSGEQEVAGATKAETIEEAAAVIGADAQTLKATIERYNAMAGTEDADYGKEAELMVSVGEGPYYVVGTYFYGLTSYAGPVVDEYCRVLTEAGEAIPGLYAAGELAATNVTSYDHIGHGMSLQYCTSMGRIAAEHATAE